MQRQLSNHYLDCYKFRLINTEYSLHTSKEEKNRVLSNILFCHNKHQPIISNWNKFGSTDSFIWYHSKHKPTKREFHMLIKTHHADAMLYWMSLDDWMSMKHKVITLLLAMIFGLLGFYSNHSFISKKLLFGCNLHCLTEGFPLLDKTVIAFFWGSHA